MDSESHEQQSRDNSRGGSGWLTRIVATNPGEAPLQPAGDEVDVEFKAYRTAWELFNLGSRDSLPAPLHLDIEMQDACNQACVMCPRNRDLHPDLPFEIGTRARLSDLQLRELILQAAQLGVRSVNFGLAAEPLIRNVTWDLVRLAHENGILDTRLITNGLLLEDQVEKVFSSGLRNLFVSIDAASADTYLRVRGRGFERVVRGLTSVLDERRRRGVRRPIVRVSFVIQDENAHELEEFAAYWSPRVDFVDVQERTRYNARWEAGWYEQSKTFECREPWRRLAVMADGSIIPCCDFNGKNVPVGRVGRHSLDEVWNGTRLAEVRRKLVNASSVNCERCQRSLGGCQEDE